jgi:hypothetical protein
MTIRNVGAPATRHRASPDGYTSINVDINSLHPFRTRQLRSDRRG